MFDACGQCFKDLCDTCEGCTWKADASALIMHRSTPGTRTVLLDPDNRRRPVRRFPAGIPFAAGPRISLTGLGLRGLGIRGELFRHRWLVGHEDVPNASCPAAANLAVDTVTNCR